MNIKQFRSKVDHDGTIKVPEELDIDEGSEVNVILTEGEEGVSSSDIAKLIESGRSFDFLDSEKEDLYSEDDLKVEY